jgi:serine/threonine protein kinase
MSEDRKRVGDFEVHEKLGEGSFGRVYRVVYRTTKK